MTPAISDSIIWHNVPGELALLDARDGTYLALNGTAADIWRALADGLAPDAIAATLAERHGAPLDVVTRDVAEFLADAQGKGLLEDR